MQPKRSFARFAFVLGSVATFGLAACAVSTENAQESAESGNEALTLLKCADGQRSQCYPGEGIGGKTLCACVPFPLSSECAPPVVVDDACSATVVPVPQTLSGLNCTTGVLINGTPVWACPASAKIPHWIDYTGALACNEDDAGVPEGTFAGCEVVGTFTDPEATNCFGPATSPYQFVQALIVYSASKPVIAHNCGASCAFIPH